MVKTKIAAKDDDSVRVSLRRKISITLTMEIETNTSVEEVENFFKELDKEDTELFLQDLITERNLSMYPDEEDEAFERYCKSGNDFTLKNLKKVKQPEPESQFIEIESIKVNGITELSNRIVLLDE